MSLVKKIMHLFGIRLTQQGLQQDRLYLFLGVELHGFLSISENCDHDSSGGDRNGVGWKNGTNVERYHLSLMISFSRVNVKPVLVGSLHNSAGTYNLAAFVFIFLPFSFLFHFLFYRSNCVSFFLLHLGYNCEVFRFVFIFFYVEQKYFSY